MMSWLEEEIGIPPEPKHPRAVGPVIQTTGGKETEEERESPREKKKGQRKMGAWVNP